MRSDDVATAAVTATDDVTATLARPRLVMYVHPHCPCTRASLAELAKLTAGRGDALDVDVVVVAADGMEDGWKQGAIVRAAEAVHGVRVRTDDGAREARTVGAYTSGQTLLFGNDGTLLFAGGITRSRGHEGDNAGTRAITTLLADSTSTATFAASTNRAKRDVVTTPVFGCPLFESKACRSDKECHASNSPVSETTLRNVATKQD